MKQTPTSPVAYSYVRFSSPEQAKGDSLRRQTEAVVEWCAKNGVMLDESTTLHDLGQSAYTGEHRQNPDRHALAAFLKLVENGRVPRDSYLVIENLDRLSRENEVPACHLLTGILMTGVRVVQLSPYEMLLTEKSNGWELMRAVMELSRGHGESAMKSERVGKAWAEKRDLARKGEKQKATKWVDRPRKFLTSALPAWVEERDGELVLIPERAAVVQSIFEMAANGYGLCSIIAKLTADKVPAMGKLGHQSGKRQWVKSYVARILADRRALGEYQPRRRPNSRERPADGEPIPNYFPAVVSEEQFYAARAGASARKNKKGRVAKRVNVFAGLLKNAREGDSYYLGTRIEQKTKRHHVLIHGNADHGRGRCYSFPFDPFERAVLDCLREIDPHEILNGDTGPDESLSLAGELATVEAQIGQLEGELLKGDVAAVVKVLRQLEERKRDLNDRLADARQKAAHPASESWGEMQSIMAALDAAPDPVDARLRLRSALRRIVDGIWLLVVPRGRDRMCAVQIWFSGGKRQRSYLILHRPPRSNGRARKEGGTWRDSLARAVKAGKLDIRKRADARDMETALVAVDVEELPALLEPLGKV